jgi:hypothetical protein
MIFAAFVAEGAVAFRSPSSDAKGSVGLNMAALTTLSSSRIASKL